MELDDLIDNIRGYFLSQYNNSATNTQTYVAFEPLGHMISPDNFQLNGQFNETIAAEELSLITDVIPAIDSIFVPDGINSISGAYSNLLNSAQFYDKDLTGDITPYVSLFGNMKNSDLQEFVSQASVEDPNGQVYLCKGSPGEWYDQSSSIWQHKNFATGNSSSTGTPATQTGGNTPVLWKLNPIDTQLQRNKTLTPILNSTAVYSRLNGLHTNTQMDRPVAVTTVQTRPTVMVSHVNTQVATPRMEDKSVILQPTQSVASSSPTLIAPVKVANNTTSPLMLSSANTINKATYETMNRVLPLNKMILVNRALGQNNNAQTSTVQSNQFQMDFDYSLVYLNRPWMQGQLMQISKLWYAIAQKAGFYSSGVNDATNTGILRAIPKAMIVIKALTVTANWSDQDKSAASSAYGLGSFNISTSSFSNNSLSAPGIQIIGWVCEVLPELPLNNDVNFYPDSSTSGATSNNGSNGNTVSTGSNGTTPTNADTGNTESAGNTAGSGNVTTTNTGNTASTANTAGPGSNGTTTNTVNTANTGNTAGSGNTGTTGSAGSTSGSGNTDTTGNAGSTSGSGNTGGTEATGSTVSNGTTPATGSSGTTLSTGSTGSTSGTGS